MCAQKSTFRLETDFISLLHNRITAEGNLVRKALSEQELELLGFYEPSEPEVEKFIEVTFWASLIRVEGRSHDFNVALMPPPYNGAYAFLFNTPVLFQPDELAKLAPALKASETIGVRVNENQEMVIWGFMEIVGMGLSIKTFGPGQVLLSFASEKSNNVFVTGSRASFVDSSKLNLSSALLRKMSADPAQETDLRTFTTAFFRSYYLEKVAEAMRSHGHGGTLLLVSQDTGWQRSISRPYKYDGEPYNRAKLDLEKIERARPKVEAKKLVLPSGDYRDAVDVAQKSLESIGQLTAIDGATVVGYDMAVLAFGVKITPVDSQKKPERVLALEPFEDSQKQEISVSQTYGTRHLSASQFVFDQRESMAIVASQDGQLSVFTWDAAREVVTMLRHAEFVLN